MISVNIPVFNERENLRPLFERLTKALADMAEEYEVLFVDDGSTDGSDEVLAELAAQDPRIKVIRFVRNFGQTAAFMAGFQHSTGRVVIPMDADLQNDPADIPRLLEKLEEGYDVVSGWRKKRMDGLFFRLLPSWSANWMISHISGVNLHDYGCSLKAYRRDMLADVRLYGEMHRFIPIYMAWRGGRVAEIPVAHHPRIHGKSKYGLSRVIGVLLDLFVIRFLDSAIDRPMRFFGVPGILSFVASFISFGLMFYFKFGLGISFILTPLPLLTVMFFILGVLCLLLGIVAEMLIRVYFESQNKTVYSIAKTLNI